MPWSVYILRCSDGTLYTGVTTDVCRRVAQHDAGKGAKYTRGRRPVEFVASVNVESRSAALVLEALIKRLPKEKKVERLLEGP